MEDHFKSPTPEVIAKLRLAQRCAEKLKLDSFCEPYSSITLQPLRVCRSETDELLFTTVYQPARNRQQTDLFFDSAPVFATQNLIRAIVDQRIDAIPGCLSHLRSLDREKCSSFERLLAEHEQCTCYPETGTKIDYLKNILSPTAFEVLGRFASDFLIPCWQQLSRELALRKFDAGMPDDHLSFTAFRALEWRDVVASVENEENWKNQPILLFRHAEACFKANQEAQGLESWFQLFLDFPEKAERMVGDTGNFLLVCDWMNFNDLDPGLEPAFFPAWTVLKKPALAKITVALNEENSAGQALQMIRALVGRTDNAITQNTLHVRARLRHLNPNLFVHYMAANR